MDSDKVEVGTPIETGVRIDAANHNQLPVPAEHRFYRSQWQVREIYEEFTSDGVPQLQLVLYGLNQRKASVRTPLRAAVHDELARTTSFCQSRILASLLVSTVRGACLPSRTSRPEPN